MSAQVSATRPSPVTAVTTSTKPRSSPSDRAVNRVPQQPADLADVPEAGSDPLVGAVVREMGGRGDPAAVLGDQGDPVRH